MDCEVIGLMQQIEDGQEDHNILARLPNEAVTITPEVESTLIEFVTHVFDHIDGKEMRVGRFLGQWDAEAHVRACMDEE